MYGMLMQRIGTLELAIAGTRRRWNVEYEEGKRRDGYARSDTHGNGGRYETVRRAHHATV